MRTIIFVSDMFVDQYSGGAELTTAALMMTAPKDRYGVGRLNSKDVTKEMLEKHKNDLWVVCNFTDLSEENKIYMCRNVEYSIIEYDYKLCEFRSLQKHKMATGSECNCLENISGKINMAFYGYAKKIWFMSEGQKKVFFSKLPVLKEEKCEVLSSIFSPGDLRFMNSLRDNEKGDSYIILNSDSWIKGTEDCIAYAKANDLKYELVQNLTYHELLIKMSCSRGLIFRPLGDDTCPRISIEARLLGCELITNEHVQHRDESWFATPESAHEYMSTRSDVFWSHYAQ
tara:strand:+ start:3007 stop:3864 length:858 start_codon:yes stop_codon:yes gene_type:complete